MLEAIGFLMLGLVAGTVATHLGLEVLRQRTPWRPAVTSQIRKKLKRESKLDDFLDGLIRCSICDTSVTFKNLWSIVEDDEFQEFVCRNPDCVREYTRQLHAEMLSERI